MGLSFARAACMLAPCAFSHWSLSFFRISFTASLHLFGVFPCFAKAHKIIRVSYDRTFSNEFPTAIVGDADSLFHPVQGDVGQQGRRHAPYNVANFGHLFLREAVACGEED